MRSSEAPPSSGPAHSFSRSIPLLSVASCQIGIRSDNRTPSLRGRVHHNLSVINAEKKACAIVLQWPGRSSADAPHSCFAADRPEPLRFAVRASLRTSPHIHVRALAAVLLAHVPAFADMRLTLSSPGAATQMRAAKHTHYLHWRSGPAGG